MHGSYNSQIDEHALTLLNRKWCRCIHFCLSNNVDMLHLNFEFDRCWSVEAVHIYEPQLIQCLRRDCLFNFDCHHSWYSSHFDQAFASSAQCSVHWVAGCILLYFLVYAIVFNSLVEENYGLALEILDQVMLLC